MRSLHESFRVSLCMRRRGWRGFGLAGVGAPCPRAACLRDVVDGDAVRTGDVALEHALHVGGGDRLQRDQIRIDMRRSTADQRGLAQREGDALRGLALLEFAGQQLRIVNLSFLNFQ